MTGLQQTKASGSNFSMASLFRFVDNDSLLDGLCSFSQPHETQAEPLVASDPQAFETPSLQKKHDAFSTIATLLSSLQDSSGRESLVHSKEPTSQSGALHLHLNEAFATLAVMDKEIVAVASSHEDKDVLKLLVSYNSSLVNPCRDLHPVGDEHCSFGSSVQPAVKDMGRYDPFNDVWLSNSNPQLSMSIHLSTLAKLVCDYEPGTKTKKFLNYVFSACYRKMSHRMNHKVSNDYIEQLSDITKIEFTLSAISTPSKMQMIHDWNLLHCLLACFTQNELEPANYSVLKAIAESLPTTDTDYNGDGNLVTYSENMVLEFHHLLCHILKAFRNQLTELETKAEKMIPAEFERTVHQTIFYGFCLLQLHGGSFLEAHLKSLQYTIMREAACKAKSDSVTVSQSVGDHSTDANDQPDEEIESTRVFAKGSDDNISVSCPRWIKLILSHFYAAGRLKAFASEPQQFRQQSISVELVVAPYPKTKLIPWEELFSNTHFFPKMIDEDSGEEENSNNSDEEENSNNSDEESSNNFDEEENSKLDLVTFVKSGVDFAESLYKASLNLKSETRNIFALKEVFSRMKNARIDLSMTTAGNLSTTLEALGNDSSAEECGKIAEDIDKLLRHSFRLFSDLSGIIPKHGVQGPLQFTGTQHCEATLASILYRDANIGSDLKDRLKVFRSIIGVSQPCCDVCYSLISYNLRDSLSQQLLQGSYSSVMSQFIRSHDPLYPEFLLRGYHDSVYPCSLPGYLPEHVVDLMIERFAEKLRQQLCVLNSKIFRGSRSEPSDKDKDSDHGGSDI